MLQFFFNQLDPAADIMGPVPQSATISSTGLLLVIVFDEAATHVAVPTLVMDGGAVTAAYLSGSGTTEIRYVLSRAIEYGQEGTVFLAPSAVRDALNNGNISYTGAITNESYYRPFPTDSNPENRTREFSNICSIGPRAYVITGYLCERLKTHFLNSAKAVEEPSFQDTLWSTGISTDINIEPITRWKPHATDLRLSILVRRNAQQFSRIGIGDGALGGQTLQGEASHARMGQGSHTLFCAASEAAEAERLAVEVKLHLEHFADVIRQELLLVRFEVVSLDQIGVLHENEEYFVTPVTVTYNYVESWRVVEQAPPIKKIRMSFLT
jgi:hypothetical protein